MRRRGDLSLGLVSGVAAGLAASFVMNQFQGLWSAYDEETRRKAKESKPATLKAADKASEILAGAPVPEPAQKLASNSVHYLTGAVLGGLYGVVAEFIPAITAGAGTVYGSMAWVVMDELLTPSLDLAPPPSQTTPKEHAYGLASHLVFGLVLELVRDSMAEVL